MVDKNLFLYDLAIVAIFKNEARYLKEWLDYHLLAGVDHFYLYNNESTDDYAEVLAPYIEKNLVTLTEFPGKIMQIPAYKDAIDKYRFESRYMAFIDLDEFIYPKTNQNISEVVDEILSRDENAAGLAINWQCFGSNGQEKADFSRGVLERFTRRVHNDSTFIDPYGNKTEFNYVKMLSNPRLVLNIFNPHAAVYFNGEFLINSDGKQIVSFANEKPLTDKIVVNHYIVKSREEFFLKQKKGRATINAFLKMEFFSIYDHNEVFDDGILKYRAERAKNFSFEGDQQRINRVINSLVKTLTQSEKFFTNKLETFLVCRAVAEKFQLKIGKHFAEEIALAWIYRTLVKPITYAEIQMFLKALPEILARPFKVCKDIKDFTQNFILPNLCETLKNGETMIGAEDWKARSDLLYIQQLLSLIKL